MSYTCVTTQHSNLREEANTLSNMYVHHEQVMTALHSLSGVLKCEVKPGVFQTHYGTEGAHPIVCFACFLTSTYFLTILVGRYHNFPCYRRVKAISHKDSFSVYTSHRRKMYNHSVVK